MNYKCDKHYIEKFSIKSGYAITWDHINNGNWSLDDCGVWLLTSQGSILILSGKRVKTPHNNVENWRLMNVIVDQSLLLKHCLMKLWRHIWWCNFPLSNDQDCCFGEEQWRRGASLKAGTRRVSLKPRKTYIFTAIL